MSQKLPSCYCLHLARVAAVLVDINDCAVRVLYRYSFKTICFAYGPFPFSYTLGTHYLNGDEAVLAVNEGLECETAAAAHSVI